MGERLTRVRHLLAELDVDAILISHPANRRYVSGFPDEDHAPDETSGILFISGREARLFVSPTNLPWALASAGSEIDVVGFRDVGRLPMFSEPISLSGVDALK